MMNEFIVYTIIAAIIIFFLIVGGLVLYKFVTNSISDTYYLVCEPNKCATNIYNGEKRCGINNIPIIYNPAFEVCNSRYACDNLKTPYALRNDGSTDITGICDFETPCRCLTQAQCGYETLVTFSVTNNGINFINPTTSGNTSIINQNALQTQGYVGTPLILNDPNSEYCAIKLYNFNRAVPRTVQCNFIQPDNPTLQEAELCINSNPCTIGTLAFAPQSIDDFSFSGSILLDVPVGCFSDLRSAAPCKPFTIPVWNLATTTIVCLP